MLADVELTDLVVVARGEVRLVGVFVADRREGGDLALGVQFGERRRARVPLQAGVLGEGLAGAGRLGDVGTEFRVERVADRGEHAHRVDPAFEEDRDQDLLRGRRLGDAAVEGRERDLRGAVDGERDAGAAGEELAPGEAGAGGVGIPGSIAGRPRPASAAAPRRS